MVQTAYTPSKPTALPVIAEHIPAELTDRCQWVTWRYILRAEKWTKIPYTATTGREAKSTDPVSWSTFAEALARYQGGDADGIGYVFAADDPYCGVDLDDAATRRRASCPRGGRPSLLTWRATQRFRRAGQAPRFSCGPANQAIAAVPHLGAVMSRYTITTATSP